MKKLLSDLTLKKIEEIVLKFGAKSYRAKQIYSGILNDNKISQMNIDLTLKENLLQEFEERAITIVKSLKSKDGSVKFLLKLADFNIIEGVVMQYKYGNTICISTQIGCRMNCNFCASGKDGLVRNLSGGEMLSQVIAVNNFLGGTASDRKITNIVLMGSGEPLDNYDNTVWFLKNIISAQNLNISARNISLSTCGLADKIRRFADEKMQVNLSLSLHSPFDSQRQKIMPIAKAFTVEQILQSLDYFFKQTKRRYILEYSLISGINDREEDLQELIKLLRGKPCHVNLIRLNAVKENNLKGTSVKGAHAFLEGLQNGGISATVRRSMGEDIEGACGQLRNTFVQTVLTRS